MQVPEFLLISKQKSHTLALIPCTPVSQTLFAMNGTLKTSNYCYTFDYTLRTSNNKMENGRKNVLVFNFIFFCRQYL